MKIPHVALYLVFALCIIMATPFLFTMREAKGIPVEIPVPEKMEKYLTVQCVEFSMASKTVCMHPSGARILESKKEKDDFIINFWTLVIMTKGVDIPSTSWFDVVVMPEGQVFAELSNGSDVYARGEGDTLNSAMEDLIVRFSTQPHDVPNERHEERHEGGFIPLYGRGATIDV